MILKAHLFAWNLMQRINQLADLLGDGFHCVRRRQVIRLQHGTPGSLG